MQLTWFPEFLGYEKGSIYFKSREKSKTPEQVHADTFWTPEKLYVGVQVTGSNITGKY